MTTEELESKLYDLRLKKKKLVQQIDDADTVMIGIKLELEKRKECSDYAEVEERNFERSRLFDDES